jgi:hypothetical protein
MIQRTPAQDRIIEAEEKDRRKDPHGIGKANRAQQGEPTGRPTSDRANTETGALPDPEADGDKEDNA